MCFDEKIRNFVYPLERRKIRSQSRGRKNTNSQFFNGVLSGAECWVPSHCGKFSRCWFMYPALRKIHRVFGSAWSCPGDAQKAKGCWTSRPYSENANTAKEVHSYFTWSRGESPLGPEAVFSIESSSQSQWFTRMSNWVNTYRCFLNQLLVHHCLKSWGNAEGSIKAVCGKLKGIGFGV